MNGIESSVRRNAAWALVSLAYLFAFPYFERLNNPNENVRIWATRVLRDHIIKVQGRAFEKYLYDRLNRRTHVFTLASSNDAAYTDADDVSGDTEFSNDEIEDFVLLRSGKGDEEFGQSMYQLGAVVDDWMKSADVQISAVQCWTSLEENLGVVPCTVMSMMSDSLLSSACEVDVCGVLGMHVLQLASGTPSALLDWNNNYGTDPNKAVCFHCSNLPKHFFNEVKMDFQEIIAGTVGKENTFGTCVGRVKAGAMSFARFSTDDVNGEIRGYTGGGRFTDDPLQTFGGAGVVEIPGLQKLLHYICENGFEHHVAANFSTVGPAVHEAASKYLGWDMHAHQA